MSKLPKYLKDDNGCTYQIFETRYNAYSNRCDEFIFDCRSVRLTDIVFSTNSFEIKKVHFNDPATIVIWADGTKTVVKCGEEDIYDPQTGLLMCIAKKAYGNKGKFNDILREWMPEEVNAVDAAVNAFEAFANLMRGTLVKKEDIDAGN